MKILQDKTPEEVWTARKPSIHHLRVFGCTAYMHVPDKRRKKIDPKTLPCLFLGFSTTSNAYRLMDPEMKKIYESRDVVCDESSFDSLPHNEDPVPTSSHRLLTHPDDEQDDSSHREEELSGDLFVDLGTLENTSSHQQRQRLKWVQSTIRDAHLNSLPVTSTGVRT